MKQRTTYMNPIAIGFIMLVLGLSFSLAQFKVIPQLSAAGTPQHIGSMMSYFTILPIFLAIPAGGLIQKFGAKAVVLGSAIILMIGGVIGGLSGYVNGGDITGGLVASRIVEGIGYGILAAAGPAMVAMFTEPAKIGRAMGIWVCWVSVGQIIAFNFTNSIIGSLGFAGTWYLYVGICVVGFLLVLLTMKAPSAPAPAADAGPQEKVSLSMALNKDIILVGIAYCGFNCLMLALLNNCVGPAMEAGLSPAAANFMASIPMIGCFISGPLFGNLSIKLGCKKLFIIGLCGAILGIILVFTSSIPMIYLGAILYGLLGLGVPGMAFSAVPQLVKDMRLMGLGNGIMTTFQSLGMWIASVGFMAFVGFGGGSFFMGSLYWAIPIGIISLVCVLLAKFK